MSANPAWRPISFTPDRPPASTLIPVPTLALESLEFEIDAIVVTPIQ